MCSEVVRCGGVESTNPGEDDAGVFRNVYRGFYLFWDQNRGILHVARVADFDRWANSRVYRGESPTTMEALDALLSDLEKDTGARDRLYGVMMEGLMEDLVRTGVFEK